MKRLAARDPQKAAQLRKQLETAGAPAPNGGGGKNAVRSWAVGGNECMGVNDGRAGNAALLIRGEISQAGESVPRGFVTVLNTAPPPSIPGNESGRRELAEWLTSKSNPLTARVEVNRIWLHLFGQGLVRTADNFGTNGEAPSHPELLDTLAVQFMDEGWSVKRLIRSIVLSHTYQLSSATTPAGNEIDPDNRLLWRASSRRLDAEAIRDAILAASGQLQLTPPRGSVVANIGEGYIGKGIRPEIFSDVTANYRSVYLPIVRDFPPEVLDIFDFAEPSLVIAARDVTNVPSQALYLMNNQFVRDQAAAMAKRVLATPLDYPQRITPGLQARSRPGADGCRAGARRPVPPQRGREASSPSKMGRPMTRRILSWSTFCQALFACAEFRYLQ